MVYSAFFCDEDQLSVLSDLGCAGNELRRSGILFSLIRIRFETIN
jgi:hypothetical protein